MTAETFRKDKYLRACGYNFYVWAGVNLLVTWPLWSALAGRPWPVWLAVLEPIALIVIGVVLSALNDNRVEKMWGAPNERAVVDVGSFWGPLLLVAFVLTVVLSIRGPVAYVPPVWLLLVGAAYWMWGNFAIPEFRWFGGALVAAGTVAGLAVRPEPRWPGRPSPEALLLWMLFMGILWLPFGAYINRKYVYPAPAERSWP